MFLFFFFQAEDGIRDVAVTGVQTCALPISSLADIEDKKRWSADVLLTYLVNPGTALQVGYTDQYENLALIAGSVERSRRPDLSTVRQLFVKLNYLWRL